MSQRSLDHGRGSCLIPGQVRGGRRDERGGEGDHFALPLQEKSVSLYQESSGGIDIVHL
jgi:hypothetical protein